MAASNAIDSNGSNTLYYELNHYSGKLHRWSMRKLSMNTCSEIPVGILGLACSVIGRVAEAFFMLIANFFLGMKYLVSGAPKKSEPIIPPPLVTYAPPAIIPLAAPIAPIQSPALNWSREKKEQIPPEIPNKTEPLSNLPREEIKQSPLRPIPNLSMPPASPSAASLTPSQLPANCTSSSSSPTTTISSPSSLQAPANSSSLIAQNSSVPALLTPSTTNRLIQKVVRGYETNIQNRVTSMISTIGAHQKTSLAAAGVTGIAAAGLAYAAAPIAAAAAPIALPLAVGAGTVYAAWKKLRGS